MYDANDPGDNVYGSLPGALVREEGEEPVGEWSPDAEAAWIYAGDTYDYFSDHHGRDSYDGAGATLISTVEFCPERGNCPFQNAFWNGLQMVYGAGFALADDVAAHELTHAVTERAAALFYYMQSGALNESYSDIFGETVDLLNSGGNDSPEVRWHLGEDVPELGAIRDLKDPTRFDDPGKTSDPEFVCGDPGTDRGGVHSNSGVPNHAYALMVDGGTYNGITVEGIGLVKAGKIQYRTLSRYLVSASDFIDNADALAQSCRDLVGIATITGEDCEQVDRAIRAVEMDQGWACNPAQPSVPSLCGPEQGHQTWYLEDFERLESPPPCSPGRLPKDWCINQPSSLLGEFATSGERSLWGYNQKETDLIEVRLEIPVDDLLPEHARLQLNHSYGFENTVAEAQGETYFWDGGVIEVSDDDGATWSDAGGLVTAGAAYGGVIDAREDNPLGGREAFVGDSWGYTASQLDLGSLAGGAFGIRFLVGTDYMLGDYGWFIDDVRIYTCVGCPADLILDADDSGTESHHRASRTILAGDGFSVGADEAVTLEAGGSVALGDAFAAEGRLTVVIDPEICP